MEFTQEIAVAVAPDRAWAFLWDIEKMARCIPGCQSAREIEAHKRYEAVVAERVGPFKVQFPLAIEVVESQPPTRLVAVANGKDNSMGSSVKMRLDLTISADGGRTVLRISADVNIVGKLAALGHSMVKRKADEVMTQFARSLRTELEGLAGDAAAV
jgi:carbon monoxide dehydrogenase subunit G